MQRSLLLVTGIYPPDAGGPAKFARNFAIWSLKEYGSVDVICYCESSCSFPADSKVSVHGINRHQRFVLKFIKFLLEIRNLKRDNQDVLAVGSFLEIYFASILLNFSYITKVPGDIVWERARNQNRTQLGINDFQHSKMKLKFKIFRFLYSQSLKKSTQVIVPSLYLKKLCLGWGVKEENIKLIFNGVDIPPLIPRFESKVYDVITVCRLVSWKGVEELIRVCALAKLKLVVVGDGPLREQLEELALTLKSDTTFVGETKFDHVADLIQESKIFVLNSSYEGLPHALIEARALGTFSIARSGTGSDEVISHMEDGLLVSTEFGLERAVDFAFEEIALVNAMVQKAYQDAGNRFNKAHNYETILSIVSGL
jgi:glycosyltransferase involved in cell wall biosynthesis